MLRIMAMLSIGVFVSLFFIAFFLTNSIDAHKQDSISPDTITGVYDSETSTGEFYGQKVASSEVVTLHTPPVLGSTTEEKRIEVDLSTQRLYAFEGERLVYDFLISSGKWGRTPTGTFRIWSKFTYTKMSGGSRALGTYYYLPNVPYTMFFSNSEIPAARGYGIHGTYWHDNFGTPMSHGCINMRTEEAELLFHWVNPAIGGAASGRATADNQGTEVIIYGVAPQQ